MSENFREVVKPSPVPLKGLRHPDEPERLLAIASNTLKPSEEKIIAGRLRQILALAAKRARS
jgi:hypothetical protein